MVPLKQWVIRTVLTAEEKQCFSLIKVACIYPCLFLAVRLSSNKTDFLSSINRAKAFPQAKLSNVKNFKPESLNQLEEQDDSCSSPLQSEPTPVNLLLKTPPKRLLNLFFKMSQKRSKKCDRRDEKE